MDVLRRHAHDAAARAHTPYSGRPAAAVLLLSDGAWVPGVRVESASFSLVIPALVNALSTAVAAGRRDVVAAVLDHAATPDEAAFLATVPDGAFERAAEDAFVRRAGVSLPPASERLDPFLDAPLPASSEDGIALARAVAERALVPESSFPVGCVLAAGGRLVPGVNVEHPDWSRVLCAERNALGTAVSYGLPEAEALYLTCLKDPAGTPCGACRQLLVELASAAVLWMDRGDNAPASAAPSALLPGAFDGRALEPPAGDPT
ncbi:MAG: cytidine deaminase [Rhodothermales bacterium]|nr:cytidine deaminase [Rhodothermales bacterium]